MRLPVLALVATVVSITPVRAEADAEGLTVTAGSHALGTMVFGAAEQGSAGIHAGVMGGVEIEVGEDPGAVAIVVEHLYRYPTYFATRRERTVVVEYRHHFAKRGGGGRAGFMGFGGGVRRADDTDELGAAKIVRGYDFRVEGGVALATWTKTVLHLRFGINYGCYTSERYDDGRRENASCGETFFGQMFIGADLARRW